MVVPLPPRVASPTFHLTVILSLVILTPGGSCHTWYGSVPASLFISCLYQLPLFLDQTLLKHHPEPESSSALSPSYETRPCPET